MKSHVKNSRNQLNYVELASSVLLLHFIFWLLSKCFYPISGPHSFRQAQTNWPVKVWSLNGFAPFHPEVPVKGPEHFTWLLEFPLFQWIVYLVHTSLNIPIDFASRLSGLSFALGTVSIFSYVIHKKFGISFNLTLVFFVLNPYFIYWGTTGLIDWAAVFLGSCASFLIFVDSKRNTKIYVTLLAAVLLSLGSMIKPSHAILSFYFVLSIELFVGLKKIKNIKYKIFSSLWVLGIGIVSGALWTIFIKYKYNDMDPRHIWVVSEATRNWYFGSKEQYQNGFWESWRIISQTLQNNLGIYLLVVSIIISIYKIRSTISSVAIFMGVVLYIFVFINLNTIHTYYQIPVYLGLTILILIGVSNLKTDFRSFIIVPILVIYLLQINFQSTMPGETSKYLEIVKTRSDVFYECPKFVNKQDVILTFQQENPYNFYFCGFKTLMVASENGIDYEVAKKYQASFKYVFASDSGMYTKAASFFKQFDKELTGTVAPSYFKVE
jgi:hypothetical protein